MLSITMPLGINIIRRCKKVKTKQDSITEEIDKLIGTKEEGKNKKHEERWKEAYV